jgi:autophagy-related protein 9
MAQENKMEQSFLHFKITNPEWQPSDSAASMFLSRVVDGESRGSERLNSPFRLRNGTLRSAQLAAGRPARPQADAPFIGTEEERLKQKASLYEAALQRSLRLQRPSGASKSAQSGRSSRLQPMEERPEVEDEDGWETAKLGTRLNDDDQMRDSMEGESGPGMLGLIHEVIKK